MFDGAKYAAMPKSAILPHSALIYQNLLTTDAITEDEDWTGPLMVYTRQKKLWSISTKMQFLAF